jgi:hypothetical protein
MVELYFCSPIRLHGIVLNYLSTETILPYMSGQEWAGVYWWYSSGRLGNQQLIPMSHRRCIGRDFLKRPAGPNIKVDHHGMSALIGFIWLINDGLLCMR